MSYNTAPPITAPPSSLVTVTHCVYALHTLSLLIGVTTAATIVGAFVFGVPSFIAVVINYLKRGEARGTFLESHFRWQIRTFWFALLWCVIGAVLFVSILGVLLAIAVFFAAGVWAIYRIVRGWLALRDQKPMYMKSSRRNPTECSSAEASSSIAAAAPQVALRKKLESQLKLLLLIWHVFVMGVGVYLWFAGLVVARDGLYDLD